MAGNEEVAAGVGAREMTEENKFPFEWIKDKLGGECPEFAMSDNLLKQFIKLKDINLKTDENMKNLGRVTEIAQIELNVQDEKSSDVLSLLGLAKKSFIAETPNRVACVVTQTPGLNEKMSCEVAVLQCLNKHAAMKTQRAKLNMLKKQAARDLELQAKVAEKITLENKQLRLRLEVAGQEEGLQQSNTISCEEEHELASLADKRTSLQKSLADVESHEDFMALHCAHQRVVKLQTELAELRRKQHKLQVQSAKYGSLPPDLTLARVEIDNLKTKLQDLKGEIAFLVSAISEGGYM